jgi:hypothetical protein
MIQYGTKILELMEAVDAWIEPIRDVASLLYLLKCILNYWSWNCCYRVSETGVANTVQLKSLVWELKVTLLLQELRCSVRFAEEGDNVGIL